LNEKFLRSIPNSITMQPIVMRSGIQVESMAMERGKDGNGDGHGGGAEVPSPQM
jgi:hypothetical protein